MTRQQLSKPELIEIILHQQEVIRQLQQRGASWKSSFEASQGRTGS